jgi:hypothetical protein
MKKMLKTWRSNWGKADVCILYLALVIWSRAHGLMSLEISSQYPPFVTDTGALYRCEMESIVNQFIGD